MSTTVTYKGSTLATVENATKTLKTAGKYMEDDVTLTDVSSSAPTLQAKTNIAPTTSSQTITPDSGYDGLSSVQINAMPSGTAGTPTATKGTVSNHAVSVTPSVTNSTGYITGGTKSGTAVSVSASELVSGTKSITANGTGIDVTNYASVDVNVSGGGGGLLGWTDISSYFTVEGTYDEYFAFAKGGCVFFYARCGWDEVNHPTINQISVDPLYFPFDGYNKFDYPNAMINNYNFDDGSNYLADIAPWDPNVDGWNIITRSTPFEWDSEFYITIAYRYDA